MHTNQHFFYNIETGGRGGGIALKKYWKKPTNRAIQSSNRKKFFKWECVKIEEN